MIRRTFATALAAATMLATAGAAMAYPDKPVTYIIPFNPGGESDITARLQQPFFEELTGQSLIIKYQAGAGGAQAWSQLNQMTGDGHVIMGTNLPHIILQPLTSNPGYETDDLTNIYMFHYTPDAIIVSKDSQFKTLQDLIDYAKANPGAVTFAGSGTNSANHLALQRFNELAGVTTTYIPFGGTGPSVTALLGGQVMAGMGYSTVAANHADDTRMLAVATEERMALFPDVPTFKELGIDMVSGAYRGIAVPASTPEDIRKELSDIIDRINHDPDFIKRMEEGGFVVTNIGYDQIDAFMAQKKKELSAIAQQMGILKQ